MRISLNLDGGIGDNWLEIDERWTKREVDQYNKSSVEDVFAVWYPKKVTACSLMKADGTYITDPKIINVDMLEDLDYRVYGFLVRAIAKVISELFLSGTRSSQVSSRGIENSSLLMVNGNYMPQSQGQ